MTGAPNMPKIKEADFQKAVLEMAIALGWSSYHTKYSIGSQTGYPDLTLVHPEFGVLWLELKTHPNKPTEHQLAWIDRIRAAGEVAYIVYPEDMDAIERLLQGERLEDTAA